MGTEYQGPERRQRDRRRGSRIRRWLFYGWLILFSLAVGYSIRENRTLAQQNRDRITDIQESRLASCKSTYQSFHAVFDPFFPPKGHRNAKQRSDIKKFNKIITAKVATCRRQITPPSIKPPPVRK